MSRLSVTGSVVATLVAALVLLAAGCGEDDAPRVDAPSILFITFDTTRRDFVGFGGRTPSPTPNLDALAAESVVFEDAYTAVPLTLPAHTTLMTGLLPLSHGVHDNGTYRVPDQADTLAEVLAAVGLDTGAAVAAYVLDSDFGLDQGFRIYDAPPRSPDDAGRENIEERKADAMVDGTVAALDVMRRPFFFWVHFFDPHAPYEPPGAAPEADRRTRYEGEIRHADAGVGRLFQELQARGLMDDLVIVFASDHGESLGDDREPTHGYFVGEHVSRVPLFLRVPGLAPRRVPATVSLADVVPTLLALLDLPPMPAPLDGRDLSRNLRDPTLGWPDAPIALECYGPWTSFGFAPFEAVVQGPSKYVRSARQELYDRVEDPGQRDDLAGDDASRLESMARLHEQVFANPASRLVRVNPALSVEELEELASLGYAVGSGRSHGERPDFDALPDLLEHRDLLDSLQTATVAVGEGRVGEAIALYRGMLVGAPDSALLHERLGGLLLVHEPDRLNEARTHFQRAIRLEFERPLSHLGLAQCAYRTAESEYENLQRLQALRRQSEAITVQRRQQEALREAVARYRVVLDLEPHQPQALLGVAFITRQAAEDWARSGDSERAASMLREALESLDLYLESIPPEHPQWRRQDALRSTWRDRLAALE